MTRLHARFFSSMLTDSANRLTGTMSRSSQVMDLPTLKCSAPPATSPAASRPPKTASLTIGVALPAHPVEAGLLAARRCEQSKTCPPGPGSARTLGSCITSRGGRSANAPSYPQPRPHRPGGPRPAPRARWRSAPVSKTRPALPPGMRRRSVRRWREAEDRRFQRGHCIQKPGHAGALWRGGRRAARPWIAGSFSQNRTSSRRAARGKRRAAMPKPRPHTASVCIDCSIRRISHARSKANGDIPSRLPAVSPTPRPPLSHRYGASAR